jgi:hypothetical protein
MDYTLLRVWASLWRSTWHGNRASHPRSLRLPRGQRRACARTSLAGSRVDPPQSGLRGGRAAQVPSAELNRSAAVLCPGLMPPSRGWQVCDRDTRRRDVARVRAVPPGLRHPVVQCLQNVSRETVMPRRVRTVGETCGMTNEPPAVRTTVMSSRGISDRGQPGAGWMRANGDSTTSPVARKTTAPPPHRSPGGRGPNSRPSHECSCWRRRDDDDEHVSGELRRTDERRQSRL